MLAPPPKPSTSAPPATALPKQFTSRSQVPPVTEKQLDILEKCIEDKSLQFSYKGSRNKKGATLVQLGIILLSVATPILIGWEQTNDADKRLFLNLALASSALTAGINMLYNFFDYKDLWVQYKVARNELEFLLTELKVLKSSGLANVTQQQIDLLFKQYRQVCTDTNSFYRETRLAKDEASIPTK